MPGCEGRDIPGRKKRSPWRRRLGGRGMIGMMTRKPVLLEKGELRGK